MHLSCHGVQHAEDPSLSMFRLADQPLTLADLATVDLPNADLAYLAACRTAEGHHALRDEALHLAAALQLVGYRHVVAALWSIADAVAPAMAEIFYAGLTANGAPNADRAAYALHQATAWLRQAWPGEPLLWVPYVHFGP
jgi:CHAT domain-containing protein